MVRQDRRERKYYAAVTGASRSAGKYELAWDGRDASGKAVARGTYTVRVEVIRQRGTHQDMKAEIECDASSATGSMKGNVEVESVELRYGPTRD